MRTREDARDVTREELEEYQEFVARWDQQE